MPQALSVPHGEVDPVNDVQILAVMVIVCACGWCVYYLRYHAQREEAQRLRDRLEDRA